MLGVVVFHDRQQVVDDEIMASHDYQILKTC